MAKYDAPKEENMFLGGDDCCSRNAWKILYSLNLDKRNYFIEIQDQMIARARAKTMAMVLGTKLKFADESGSFSSSL